MNANVIEIEPRPRDLSAPARTVCRSPQMARVRQLIERFAPHFRTVLITGETGCGKELAAWELHSLSPAAHGQFAVLNCSAIVETLFESELFGHVRGAFTGADRDKPGLFEHAHGGTLLLDEIGDMPLSTQAKLLRVLQSQQVQRVGALTGRRVDVRVIAATNKDLRAAVAAKTFREDLYYRLAMVEIHLPPLRERDGDVPLLLDHFLQEWCARCGKQVGGFTPEAQSVLLQHAWPGNVRELENAVGHACMLTQTDRVGLEDLPEYLPQSEPVGSVDALDQQEMLLIRQTLNACRGNQSMAARSLHTTRDRLRYKLKKYQLHA